MNKDQAQPEGDHLVGFPRQNRWKLPRNWEQGDISRSPTLWKRQVLLFKEELGR